MIMAAAPAKSQNNSELIIQAPGVNEKNFTSVKQQLASINGVSLSGFCNSEKFFLLTIDRNILPDNSSIEVVFRNSQLEYFYKEGTVSEAIANCKDPKPISNPAPVDIHHE
jgi:hypothetical protein